MRRVKISRHDTKVTTNKKFIIQLEGLEECKIELSKIIIWTINIHGRD